MSLISLNRHRDRQPVKLGPAVTWPHTPEQTERVKAALANAEAAGNRDLVDFYAYQLANAKPAHLRGSDDPGSAA